MYVPRAAGDTQLGQAAFEGLSIPREHMVIAAIHEHPRGTKPAHLEPWRWTKRGEAQESCMPAR